MMTNIQGIDVSIDFAYTWVDGDTQWKREVWFDAGYDCWYERESHRGSGEGCFWDSEEYPINNEEVLAYWKEYCEES